MVRFDGRLYIDFTNSNAIKLPENDKVFNITSTLRILALILLSFTWAKNTAKFSRIMLFDTFSTLNFYAANQSIYQY